MNDQYLANPGTGWFIARMGAWEWTETLLKLAAVGVAVWGVALSLTDGFAPTLNGRLPQVVILGLASLGVLAAVGDRLLTKEIISMVFVLLNNVGHWGITIALVGGLGTGTPVVAYCATMLAGDLVKLGFFLHTGLTVRNAPRGAVLGATGLFAAAYLTVLILELL